MTVPNTFANATTAIPLVQLDQNFNTGVTLGNTTVFLGNTTTSFGNVTLTNANVTTKTLALNGTTSGVTSLLATDTVTATITLPSATDTLVGKATTDTLTNKTLTSPVMTAPTLGVATATSINFGQTTLNYYGEGTFTPSVGGSATYSSQLGKYTRVGRFVHCDVNFGITTLGTGSASTISGMPFSLGAPPDANGSMGRFTSLAIACTSITPQWGAYSAQVTFMTTNAAMTTGTTNDAIMGSGTTIRFSVSGQT